MIRAYLRASTTDQDAHRTRETLDQFAVDHESDRTVQRVKKQEAVQ